jgi:hydrogenase/urease accessory protein HupE
LVINGLRSNLPRLVWLLTWAGTLVIASAHNPDTSYARVTITSNQVEFRFTYDVTTLRRIVELDTDGDDQVTRTELESQTSKIQSYLRRRIFPEINSTDVEFGAAQPTGWPSDAGDAIAKADYHQRLIAFAFHNPVSGTPEDVALTFDVFPEFGERHSILGLFVHGSVEHDVIFSFLEPDYLYDTGHRAGTGNPIPVATNAPPVVEKPRPPPRSLATRLAGYLRLGVEHIFLGYDHILFLLGLLVMSRLRELIAVVTSFTAAHTITLILATLQLVTLPSRLIETAIAATVVYVAVENLFRREPRHRWVLTFAFGLIHGFGFANVLREMELPTEGLLRCLLAFNVGVELGQLAIVCLVWPLIWWIGKKPWNRRFQLTISSVILLLGAGWLADRLFGLEMMPF